MSHDDAASDAGKFKILDHVPMGVVQPEASPAQAPLENPGTVRVLVAEDVELNQHYLGFLLERLGYRFKIVSSGLEAVHAFQDGSWDIILMDIQMPEMDGLDATERIRRLEREQELPHTPIIALTACAMPEEQEDFLIRGMDGFSPKPVHGDQLQAEMQRLLGTCPPKPVFRAATGAARSAQSAVATPATDESGLPPTPSPIFDLQDIQARFTVNHALWSKMAGRFFQEEYPQYLNRLHDLSRTPDLQETARLAHKLKSALGTLCAEPARNAAAHLERSANCGDALKTKKDLLTLLGQLRRMPAGFEAIQTDQGDRRREKG